MLLPTVVINITIKLLQLEEHRGEYLLNFKVRTSLRARWHPYSLSSANPNR